MNTTTPLRTILVTNDDGYNARGFRAAIEVARQFGRVIGIAPEVTQSGMSQAITMYKPLFLKKQHEEPGVEIYSFSGTPVDCVKMAFDYLLADRHVDLVISGINHGSNVLYSGTMGAAIEGSFYGCPSIGLSLTDHSADADFEAAILYGKQIVEKVLTGELGLPLCLNASITSRRFKSFTLFCPCCVSCNSAFNSSESFSSTSAAVEYPDFVFLPPGICIFSKRTSPS